ncbi:MAG: hypothetical protein ACR2LV_10780 [Solirubrobacteraceae bacterium]
MADPEIFISSCSRRELARRRPTRAALRMQFLIAVLLLLAAVAAFLAGGGW